MQCSDAVLNPTLSPERGFLVTVSRACRSLSLLGLFAYPLLACTDNEPAEMMERESAAARIAAAIRVRNSEIVQGELPAATDPRVTLIPLEPSVVLEPNATTIMALEVSDPDDRPVRATLMQLEDEKEHYRTPHEGGGSAVQNQLDLEAELCEGRCDTAFVVLLLEAVELEDGNISRSSTRQLIIDCRELGDPDACEEGEKNNQLTDTLLCGDVTKGESVHSGDAIIDAQLDAVRLLSDALGKREQAVQMATQSIAEALALPDDSEAGAVGSMLAARVGDETEAGLMLRLGDRGCAIKLLRVGHALRACDPTGGGELGSVQCTGVCEPAAEGGCEDASAQGCRGIVVDVDCEGVCAGACELELDSPAVCAGTCNGSCDGECLDDGDGGCAGPCSGLCTGTCRALNNGVCGGLCTGLCDAPSEDEPACNAPLRAYCTTDAAEVGCNGDCFGQAGIDSGEPLCQTNALAIGRITPRCEPPLIQLAFGFAEGLEVAQQSALAEAVDELNAPIAALITEGNRLDLLAEATIDLLAAAEGEIQERLDSELADMPRDAGLICADARLPESTSWLEQQVTLIEDLRADVSALLAPLTVIE
jgi:hypothetical protein